MGRVENAAGRRFCTLYYVALHAMASYGAIDGAPKSSEQYGQSRRIFFGIATLALVVLGAVLNLNSRNSPVRELDKLCWHIALLFGIFFRSRQIIIIFILLITLACSAVYHHHGKACHCVGSGGSCSVRKNSFRISGCSICKDFARHRPILGISATICDPSIATDQPSCDRIRPAE